MTDFVVGANLPWINYGGDFGANAWRPAGGVHARGDELTRALDRVAQAGVRQLRWFMLCDGRAGLRFAADGAPLGLDEVFFADVDAAVAAARERGIAIMFVLLDFLWCARGRPVNGVLLGGRSDILENPAKRAALLERVLSPIFERYGAQRQIVAWDVVNEPEWAVKGLGTRRRTSSVSLETMRAFVRDAVALIHRQTGQAATLGSAAAHWIGAWQALGLDFYQTHWYEHLERRAPLGRAVRDLAIDRPVLLGEFPSRLPPHRIRWVLETARSAGYTGAFVWSVLADDVATDFASAEAVLSTPQDSGHSAS
jgi:hypothetical protein